MKLRVLATAFAVVLSSFASFATAGVLTTNATVNLDVSPVDPFGAPPINQLTQLTLQSGQLFTNQVNGGAFVPGSTVRTVGIVNVFSAIAGDPAGTGFLITDTAGFPVYAIFAVEGTIIAPTIVNGVPSPTAEFTSGSIFFTSDNPAGSINAFDPETWNTGGIFSSYDLMGATDIIAGTSFGIVPAGNFNLSGANVNQSIAVQQQGQGDGAFLFRERAGDNLVNNVERAGGGFSDENIFAISTSQIFQTPIATPLTVAQIDALDAISALAGFGAFSENGYTPGSGGDFNAGLAGNMFVATEIPEPTSILVFGLCALSSLGFRRRIAKA